MIKRNEMQTDLEECKGASGKIMPSAPIISELTLLSGVYMCIITQIKSLVFFLIYK